MVPTAVLGEKGGLVHDVASGERPSRNIKKLYKVACRPELGVMGYGVDADVNCQRCLKVRWGGDKVAVARRRRPSKRDLRGRKLGRVKEAMAPEYAEIIAALKGRLIYGHLFNDLTGTTLDVRVPGREHRHYGARLRHPLHTRAGLMWLLQLGNIWDNDVTEKSFDLTADLSVIVAEIEAFIDSFKK